MLLVLSPLSLWSLLSHLTLASSLSFYPSAASQIMALLHCVVPGHRRVCAARQTLVTQASWHFKRKKEEEKNAAEKTKCTT